MMKKTLGVFLALAMCLGALAGCETSAPAGSAAAEVVEYATLAERLEAYGLDENLRFLEPRSITVEVYDRENDGGSDPTNNAYTNFIKEGMLRDHNVNVEFVSVHRWTEHEVINTMLAANEAPDVSVTYQYPVVEAFGRMDAIVDMAPYLNNGQEYLPNLFNLLGETNIFWNQDPVDGHVWAIEAILFNNMRTNTFVREDWLAALDMELPTNEDEFEAMLVAFRDNAELLLGENTANMIPFTMTDDVGWEASRLIESYVPEAITDRDSYVLGLGDRRLFWPGVKEATRTLNEWYNNGLIDPDFALQKAGEDAFQNKFRAGYVGAFVSNWDYPYRDGESGITASLHNLVGPEANFIAVDSFPNDAGIYRKYLSAPVDRKVFFPATNDEPVASLLYLDWISKFENRKWIQIGDEGVTHEVLEDGAVRTIAAEGDAIMNSPNNIDYTITLNGLDLGDQTLNARSVALGYAGVDARLIETAYNLQKVDVRIGKQVSVGTIASEDGSGPIVFDKGKVMFCTSIVAAPEDFDAVFDAGMQELMDLYGTASQAERAEKFQQFYGDVEMLP